MAENKIVITVDGNQYQIEINGISDFAVIGVLECILSDLKGINRKMDNVVVNNTSEITIEPLPTENVTAPVIEKAGANEPITPEIPNSPKPAEQPQPKPGDIKSRILKAREAIRGLKGKVDDLDLDKMTDEELQIEFDELTAQYKRLVNSQPKKK